RPGACEGAESNIGPGPVTLADIVGSVTAVGVVGRFEIAPCGAPPRPPGMAPPRPPGIAPPRPPGPPGPPGIAPRPPPGPAPGPPGGCALALKASMAQAVTMMLSPARADWAKACMA